jgi:hypothetical protein
VYGASWASAKTKSAQRSCSVVIAAPKAKLDEIEAPVREESFPDRPVSSLVLHSIMQTVEL